MKLQTDLFNGKIRASLGLVELLKSFLFSIQILIALKLLRPHSSLNEIRSARTTNLLVHTMNMLERPSIAPAVGYNVSVYDMHDFT